MLGALCIAIFCGLLAGGSLLLSGFGGWIALTTYSGIGIVVLLGLLAAQPFFAKPGPLQQMHVFSGSEKS